MGLFNDFLYVYENVFEVTSETRKIILSVTKETTRPIVLQSRYHFS